MLIARGFGHRMRHRINLLLQASQIPHRNGGDIMLKLNYMSTLFVGIDVSSKTNAVYAMDFEENKYISSSFGNNQPGADQLVNMIAECMQKHKTWIRFLSCWNLLLYTACIFQTSCRPARFSCPTGLTYSV